MHIREQPCEPGPWTADPLTLFADRCNILQGGEGVPSQHHIFDTANNLIYSGGKPIEITRKEYDILALFICNDGKIFSRNDILSKVWGDDVIVTDRTVDVTIARIRKKMAEKGNMIKNKSGYGYYFGD